MLDMISYSPVKFRIIDHFNTTTCSCFTKTIFDKTINSASISSHTLNKNQSKFNTSMSDKFILYFNTYSRERKNGIFTIIIRFWLCHWWYQLENKLSYRKEDWKKLNYTLPLWNQFTVTCKPTIPHDNFKGRASIIVISVSGCAIRGVASEAEAKKELNIS